MVLTRSQKANDALEWINKTMDTNKVITEQKPKTKQKVNFSDVLDKLKIDETFTRIKKRQKKFNKFVNNMSTEPEFNYQADLLELPTTKEGFKWLLVMVDIATKIFDIEPMKNKESTTTLDAMKTIFKRGILKKPYSSIRTDMGGEFKASFHDFLYTNKILHVNALAYRHKQMSMVESLNKILSRILLTYCNEQTIQNNLKDDYTNWTDIIKELRTELNDYRERNPDKLSQPSFNPLMEKQTYNVGDLVHFKLERPYNALNNPQATNNFRMGDIRYSKAIHKIIKVIYMNDRPYFRYILADMPNVSYSDFELIPATTNFELRLVHKIIGKEQRNKVLYYKVWWKKELKNKATWEPREQLLEDGLEDEIRAFEMEYNKKKAKERKKRNQ